MPRQHPVFGGSGRRLHQGPAQSWSGPVARTRAALVRQAWRATRSQDSEKAAKLLDEAVALDPRNRFAWIALGRAYRHLGRYEDSIPALRAGIDIVPNHISAWNDLGLSLWETGKLLDAEAAFRRQLEVASEDPNPRISLGNLLRQTGRAKEALPILERALELQPKRPSVMIALARVRLALAPTQAGVDLLKEAVRIRADPSTWNNAADALASAGVELDLADEWVQKSIAETAKGLDANEPDAMTKATITRSLASEWDTLGWVRFRQGRMSEAESYLAASERMFASGAKSDHLGQALEKHGRTDEAILAYSRALASHDPPAETRSRLAALSGEERVEAFIDAARATRAKPAVLAIGASPGPVARTELFVTLGRDSTIAEVSTKNGPLPPGAEALRKLRHTLPFPAASPAKLVLRSWYTCVSEACRADFIDVMP